MIRVRKAVAAATVAGSLLAGGAVGVALFGANAATAANPTPSPSAPSSSPGAPTNRPPGTFHSNEDPTHEASESPQREAAENSGQLQMPMTNG